MSSGYSQALFSLSLEQSSVLSTLESMQVFHHFWNTEEELKRLLLSPRLSFEQKQEIIETCFFTFEKNVISMILIMIQKGHLLFFDQIMQEYQQEFDQYHHVLNFKIKSSRNLLPEEIAFIRERLKQRFSRQEIKLEIQLDSSLGFGIKILHQDRELDLSLNNRLHALRSAL